MKNLRSKLSLFIVSCFILTSCFENDYHKSVYHLRNATDMDMTLNIHLSIMYDINTGGIIYDTISISSGEDIVFFVEEFLPPNGHEFYYKGFYGDFHKVKMDSMFIIVNDTLIKKFGPESGRSPLWRPLFNSGYEYTEKVSKTESTHTYTFLPEDFE